MRRAPPFKRLLRPFRAPLEDDVDEELRLHLELSAEALRRREGLDAREAEVEALRRFGDVGRVREACVAVDRQKERQMKLSEFFESLVQDLTYAARSLRRSPGFALVAVLTLALGIGANTALFSVVRGVLLRPLPYPQPEQLARFYPANPKEGIERGVISPIDLEDWRTRSHSFEALGGYWNAEGMSGVDLTGDGPPERLPSTYVTGELFMALRAPPLLGRALQPEDMVEGRNRVAVISHGLWQRRFGSDPGIIGRSLMLEAKPITVVGVMPAGFQFPDERSQVWLPTTLIPEDGIPRKRVVRWLSVVGRLKGGVALETAREELARIAQELEREHPESNAKWSGVTAQGLQESVVGEMRVALLVLLGAVALILLIACANLANLLLARATVRARELGVRAALGASPGRLVRQLLTESLLLSLLGGALGLLFAHWGAAGLIALAEGQLPRADEVHLDAGVLLFALGVSVLTGLVFGLLPALRAGSPRLNELLRGAGRSVGGAGARLRNGLVVAEVALAVMLAAGAGLATRSLLHLLQVDPGFKPEGAAVVTFSVPDARTTPEAGGAPYINQVLDAVRAAPGVRVAAGAKSLPLDSAGEPYAYGLPDRPAARTEEYVRAETTPVSIDYFKAMGTPLLKGRDFQASDDWGEKSPLVLIVNQAFARRYLPGKDPIGQTLLLNAPNNPGTVIGVVGDMRTTELSKAAEPAVYVHYSQMSRSRVNLVVRGEGKPLELAARVREAIWRVNGQQTLTRITSLEAISSRAVARPRLLAVLLGLFAGLGLVLGAVGIYGVLAYTVSQRRQEIGVRLALGAAPRDVLRLVVVSGMTLAGVGVLAGLAFAFGLSRLMQSVLYGIAPTDPLTFAAVALVLLGVALAACWLPARRATRVDPALALRAE
ncbi:ABC transporter permease [Aggregicoccus sp. 17bor-14]|uniref:ABC transporter permease n=1 Tax=Myxococcaceae TaxID=31 RepID=UPI00129C33D1|nr:MULTISPECIES: ABC transporter permease [Myxococcaceae]MBF5041797.1 ABC transporter permease [Simulacricoccus sp. 17bor-14]MRI87578.1 ABC transporter permease [Aggregicoccus sp. 17bor-14]